ncbi:MAG: hypothetical protein Q9194_002510 [Teloschistes cf. exilis]
MTKRDDSLCKIENQVRFRTPASVNAAATNQVDSTPSRDEQVRVSRDRLPLRRSLDSAKPFQNQGENKRLSTSSVHYGSYSKSVEQLSNSRQSSVHGFDSRSHSQVHLEHLLPKAEVDLEHYGIHEFRDGFFDATFYRPQSRNREEMLHEAKKTLPSELQTHHPLSWKHFLPRQWSGIRNIIRQITTTRSGIKLLSLSFHEALETIRQALVFPRPEDVRLQRDLSWHFVRLSTTVRDFTIDLSVSKFTPDDARSLRNLMQGIIRALLSIKPDTRLFVSQQASNDSDTAWKATGLQDGSCQTLRLTHALRAITQRLASPTADLISTMTNCISSCDAVLIQMGGQRRHLQSVGGPVEPFQSLQALLAAVGAFDSADTMLVDADELHPHLSTHPEAVSLFMFAHSLRQAADKVRALSTRVFEMQNRCQRWSLQLPSYPWYKQLNRSNQQIRHDRGGLTAGFYFRSKAQLERTMGDLLGQPFVPSGRNDAIGGSKPRASVDGQEGPGKHQSHEAQLVRDGSQELRQKIWRVLHRMQGFESRFAFKVVLVTSLLSVPAWLEQSRGWWNRYEIWWTVVTVWLMTHPRVSGTLQDLAARLLCVLLGAVWGGLAYAADNGNAYVMAVFAVVFMVPMMYRYTQSDHPRSGIMGCISFTVVSLSALVDRGQPSTVTIAWTRGLAFAMAILASILTNWIIWPFVARHELRKSLSAMMLHLAILYRGVISKYIYYDSLHQPSAKDIERSEMLEGRLREGFVRIRQLMELTRHEIRLRAPFDPLPYSALIEGCERFFDHLVEVRQSSLYWDPSIGVSNQEAIDSLVSFRRDAVAVILMNLYILASALRADQPVPRYLPSAAAARKRLISQMEDVEAKHKEDSSVEKKLGRRWADVYRYAFSSALTDIVEQLQHLQRYTKEITGEAGFAAIEMD